MNEDVQDWDVSDPVLGLEDVALGRSVTSPTTIYLRRNRDRSGVMGILNPDGAYITKAASTTGMRITGLDEQGVRFEATISWDGAQRAPWSKTPVGYRDEKQTQPIYREHSKGLLLGDYPNSGELWRAIKLGRGMR